MACGILAPPPSQWKPQILTTGLTRIPSVTYVLKKSLRSGCFMGLSHRGCVASLTGMCYQGYCDDLGEEAERELGAQLRQTDFRSAPPSSPSPAQLSMSRSLSCDAPTPAAFCCSPTQARRPSSAGVRQALPPQPCLLPAHDRQTSRADVCSIAQATRLWNFKPLQPTLSSSQNIPPHSPAQELPEQKRYEASFAICLEHGLPGTPLNTTRPGSPCPPRWPSYQ